MRRVCSCLGEATATFFLLPNGKAAIIGYVLVMTSSHHASECYLLRPDSLPAHSWKWSRRPIILNYLHVCKSQNDNLVMLRIHKMAVLNLQLRTCCTDFSIVSHTHTHIHTHAHFLDGLLLPTRSSLFRGVCVAWFCLGGFFSPGASAVTQRNLILTQHHKTT